MARRASARAWAAQWVLLALVLATAGVLAWMAAGNLARRHTAFGFGFLAEHANFDIPFRLIDWTVGDTYARALLVCTLNTLLVSALGIVAASLLGLLVGVMRLSDNWLVRNVALCWIELFRNTPQLVQIIFWYLAVLQSLPGPRQSVSIPGGMLLNIRGLYLPEVIFADWATPLEITSALLVVATPLAWRFVGIRALALPIAACGVLACGVERIDYPVMRGFNIAGGVQVVPELVAVWAGLSIYASAFIAEIVRAAIVSVHRGQREAALSLGLKPGQVLAKVVLPQALRVMVPPMTSQYLNIIKGSSLGAAVAYPELFQIFGGTVLNQTGRELETIFILMAIFLAISLAASGFMNWYNRHVALVER